MKELVAQRRITSMRTYIATKKPINVSDVRQFCDWHFRSVLTHESSHLGIAYISVCPMGAWRNFSISISGLGVSVNDEDYGRSRRFCAALAARFDGKIETR